MFGCDCRIQLGALKFWEKINNNLFLARPIGGQVLNSIGSNRFTLRWQFLHSTR